MFEEKRSAVSKGSSRIYEGSSGFIARHCVAESDFPLLQKVIEENRKAENWIDLVNSRDENGNTPLTLACASKNMKAVIALLECGAELNKTDKHGRFPLIVARDQGNDKIIDLLEEKANQTKHGIQKRF